MRSVMNRGPALGGLLMLLASCLDSTQVTFDISTDVPCADVSGVALTVGLEGQTEKAMPLSVTKSCDKGDKLNIIGTYAVRPGKNADVVASIKVALGVGQSIKVETACTAANGYQGCVVARRRISFLAHRSLTVPVEMLLICKDVQCDESSSCTKTGRCASSLVDLTKCDGDVCSTPETRPNEALPCFNESNGTALFCSGNQSWCTRSETGVKSCAAAPIEGGQSYQCREARDCGPNLMCLQGANGVLGRCATMAAPSDTVLCTLGEPVSPCPGGPRQCFADAGPGLFSCAPTDAGMTHVVTDGGLPCPRSNTALTCGGATPYCSIITGTPTCVADGGAQCWYPSQCPSGNGCYAGVTASFFNICQPGPTSDNPVALCDDSLDGGDCAPGFGCTGVFYGFRACQAIAGFDGGLIDAGTGAGASDASVSDASVSDAGVSDAGVTDAGATDAGAADGGDAG